MKKYKYYFLLSLMFLVVELIHAQQDLFNVPEWSKNATIYEVNVRQYSLSGTFKEVQKQLPVLKKMGIDILWIMPIHPVGIKGRKGSLGSYYAIQNYKAVNPEFGTLNDFKDLVNHAHHLNMKVIIDWVANHSSPDNVWVKSNLDYYTKDKAGNAPMVPEGTDWTDTVDLDYNNPQLRLAMTDAMTYWVTETDIDGFRCDVADMIPLDFWITTRQKLEKIKPMFMLAESQSVDILKAFDMIYDWNIYDILHHGAQKNSLPEGIDVFIQKHNITRLEHGYKMLFTDNHDKNSWEGTPNKNFGKYYESCIVLLALMDGMPLVYSGQEAGNEKSLSFFDKDVITWKPHSNYNLYQKLFELKHQNKALWNGNYGGEMKILDVGNKNVIAFFREKQKDRVVVLVNFSDNDTLLQIKDNHIQGEYIDYFTQEKVLIDGNNKLNIKPNGYKILVKN